MRHFIFSLLFGVGFIVLSTQAQTFNFVVEDEDEVQPVEEQQTVTKTQESENIADEQMNTETVQVEERTQEKFPDQASEEGEEEVEEEEDDEEQLIYLALNDVQSTLASIRAVSYCSGALVVFNATKKDIQQISGTIGIGDQTKTFKFSNVAPNTSLGWPIQIVGSACESITNTVPNVEIKNCKVKGMSDKKCRSKLRYIPLGAA